MRVWEEEGEEKRQSRTGRSLALRCYTPESRLQTRDQWSLSSSRRLSVAVRVDVPSSSSFFISIRSSRASSVVSKSSRRGGRRLVEDINKGEQLLELGTKGRRLLTLPRVREGLLEGRSGKQRLCHFGRGVRVEFVKMGEELLQRESLRLRALLSGVRRGEDVARLQLLLHQRRDQLRHTATSLRVLDQDLESESCEGVLAVSAQKTPHDGHCWLSSLEHEPEIHGRLRMLIIVELVDDGDEPVEGNFFEMDELPEDELLHALPLKRSREDAREGVLSEESHVLFDHLSTENASLSRVEGRADCLEEGRRHFLVQIRRREDEGDEDGE